MTACNILLYLPVNSSDKMCELFHGLIEGPVRPFIKPVAFRIIYNESVKTSPVIVQVLHEICKPVKIFEIY